MARTDGYYFLTAERTTVDPNTGIGSVEGGFSVAFYINIGVMKDGQLPDAIISDFGDNNVAFPLPHAPNPDPRVVTATHLPIGAGTGLAFSIDTSITELGAKVGTADNGSNHYDVVKDNERLLFTDADRFDCYAMYRTMEREPRGQN